VTVLARAGFDCFGRLTVFDAALVAEVSTSLRLILAFESHTVLIEDDWTVELLALMIE
jgi:hypothetical protein